MTWRRGSLPATTPGGGAPNNLRLYLRDDSGARIGAAFVNESAFDGTVHHLVFTYDSSRATETDRLKASLDGVEQTLIYNSADTPNNFVDFGFTPDFAARNARDTHSQYFNGTLDEAALYSSVLSPTDVLAHWEALAIPEPATVGLLSIAGAALLLARRRLG